MASSAFGIVHAPVPAAADEAVEGVGPFRREEARHVHAVGDVGDRVFFLGHLGPEVAEDQRRDVAVDAAHAVDETRAARGERRHVEVVALGRAAEREQLLAIDAQLLAEAHEVAVHLLRREMVVARGHRRVRREDRVRRHGLERAFQVEALAHQRAHALEHEERRVPLVDVPRGGLDAHRRQRARAAHAEHDLLLDARVAVAAVEAMRGGAVLGAVGLEVGVEEVELHAPDPRVPHLRVHVVVAEFHAHLEGLAVLHHRGDGQVAEIGVGVGRVLVALAVDRLLEIALAIEQAHRDERQRHVARGLAVVAREDAEAARVDRQALVEAELRAEIRDELALLQQRRAVGARRAVVIGVVSRERAIEIVQERGILRALVEPALVHGAQQRLRVVVRPLPTAPGRGAKERARRAVPAEPEVVGELLEAGQLGRQAGRDFEGKGGAGALLHGVLVVGRPEGLETQQDTGSSRRRSSCGGRRKKKGGGNRLPVP